MNRLGDYKLRRRLAVGGMGEVYLAEKVGPEGFVKPVVLKCVLPQLAKDSSFVELFLDEARVAALLNHPNIAQVYDFGHVDGVYFMAMEYVAGYTLDELRRKHEKIGQLMPIEHIACVASQASQGLDYAHSLSDAKNVSLGIVHRDVSPHNVMVTVDGSVKIVDFGIAKARAGLTRVEAKGAVGKFGYMSPEQSQGLDVDGRTDVFSLGVCIWELTTNKRLHNPNLSSAPKYDASRPLFTASSLRSDIPKKLDEIIARAVSIEPSTRLRSCREFHLELEKFMAAMTHYAGSTALAGYIRRLVDGEFDNPQASTSGGLVEPITSNKTGKSSNELSSQLNGVQKFEEVFGTHTAPSKTSRQMKRTPESWKTEQASPRKTSVKSPSTPPQPVNKSSAPKAQPKNKSGPAHREPAESLELDLPKTSPSPRKPSVGSSSNMVTALPRVDNTSGFRPVVVFIAITITIGLGYFLSINNELLLEKISSFQQKRPVQEMNTRFRITSSPAGAEIAIDGKRVGMTPLVVELLPDIKQSIELKKKGFATDRRELSPEVQKGLREINSILVPAATLKIRSSPAGGTVSINGVEILNRNTPFILDDVPAGRELRVTVRKVGFSPVSLKTTIEKGKSDSLFFNLKGQ